MSDYLGNLIARTVSPAAAVRPRLPSIFEPVPATREAKRGPEFEQARFVEQPPITQPSEKLAPMPLSIPTPRQSVLREPEQTVPEFSRPRKILETSQESEPTPPPTSIGRQYTPREPARISSRREDRKLSPEPLAPVQPRIFRRAAPTLREDKPSNSIRRTSDVIKSPLRDVIPSASHEVSAREERRPSQPSVASKAVVVPELRKHELLKWSAVRPVVPTIRSLPAIPPPAPAAATAPPTISVTIGRVEIRAMSPAPATPRARPKSAHVLSLEEYLRRRASGGSR
jgi:hypothetical protein